MTVVIDSSMLLLFLRPDTRVPHGHDGKPAPSHARERVENLIKELDESGATVVVPAPALAEVLVRATSDEASEVLDQMRASAVFDIVPFDVRAASELAEIMRAELAERGRTKLRDEAETWAKLKFDRQIVAIAKVCGATKIYAHDRGLETVAARVGIRVIQLQDLPLPPEILQMDLLESGSSNR